MSFQNFKMGKSIGYLKLQKKSQLSDVPFMWFTILGKDLMLGICLWFPVFPFLKWPTSGHGTFQRASFYSVLQLSKVSQELSLHFALFVSLGRMIWSISIVTSEQFLFVFRWAYLIAFFVIVKSVEAQSSNYWKAFLNISYYNPEKKVWHTDRSETGR